MTNDTPRTWREVMARNDERAAEYWTEAQASADDEARANLHNAYNADN
jgi:hypothetical protein